jgi:dihydrolipoamide dehydrogenase
MSVVGEFADQVDLLVVGGGPGGYTAALRAAELGREVTLVERAGRDGLGGTCLHVGCIPSKALIELAEAAHRTRALAHAGLDVTGATVDLARFQRHREQIVGKLAGDVARLLDRAGVRVLHGEARFNRPDRVAVRTPDDHAMFLEFRHSIVATGSRPAALPELPLDGTRIIDSTAALALTEVPDSLAVVGGGSTGLELGTAFAKLGTHVTIVEARIRVLSAFDRALTAPATRALEALGATVLTGAVPVRLDGDRLIVRGADHHETSVPAQRVLVATGRVPCTGDLGLDAAGVPVGPDGLIPVGEDQRATERIAAIGDIVAGPALAHKATAEAVVAADTLCGRAAAMDATIPLVVFTDPEIASAGLTEAQARNAGLDVRVATYPLTASGRAATLDATDGFTQVVADAATDRVVGVHVVGPHASELIAAGTLAVELVAAPADIAGTIHPHPTLSEGLHEAAARLTGLVSAGRLA